MAITRHWWVERGVGLAHVRGIEEVKKLAKAPLPQISNTDWTHAREPDKALDRAVLNLQPWYVGPVPSVSNWKLFIGTSRICT